MPRCSPAGLAALTQLADLGWSSFFAGQIGADEPELVPVRIAAVHRDRVSGLTEAGVADLVLAPQAGSNELAVGDWALADAQTHEVQRRLERKTVLARYAADGMAQTTAANVDALLIVTSCNADFNTARLERYLAFANQARVRPVIVLTKGDTSADTEDFRVQASQLQRGLDVVVIDPREPGAIGALAPWSGVGQTVALLGSSGVGKSTLANTLAGPAGASQQTGDIREQDAKGRHTTTSRSLHRIADGGWVIDMPGIRSLHMNEIAEGLGVVFAEIIERTAQCRFRDCTHMHEPGCAVLAALSSGEIAADRVERWRKLLDESMASARPRPKGQAGRRRR